MAHTFTLTKQMNPLLYDTAEMTSEYKSSGMKIMYYSTADIRSVSKSLSVKDYGQYCNQIPNLLLRKRGDKMPQVKILQNYNSAEQYQIGDIVDITDPAALIAEGKV